MVDAHCHLDLEEFKSYELSELVEGVDWLITCGTSIESSLRNVELSQKSSKVFVGVGAGYEPGGASLVEMRKKLLDMADGEKVVGIGECGLNSGGFEEEELFAMHIAVAQETDLPLIVHNRNCDEKILKMIKHSKVMLHCFTGGEDFLKTCIRKGWYISFGGIITFKKSEELRRLAKMVPDELLLSETDSPYLAPEPVRGKTNIPRNVKIVVDKLAELKSCSIEHVEIITSQNIKTLFNLN
jgi:TatD DNase family protein